MSTSITPAFNTFFFLFLANSLTLNKSISSRKYDSLGNKW
jgi:hypothetical protein